MSRVIVLLNRIGRLVCAAHFMVPGHNTATDIDSAGFLGGH